jgi:hypothetical protein
MPKRVPTSYVSPRRWSAADARLVLEAQARSGLSVRGFAEQQGLDEQRLHRWSQRLAEVDASSATEVVPKFLEIANRSAGIVEVVLCSGRVVRVSDAIEPGKLRRLVDALEDVAC